MYWVIFAIGVALVLFGLIRVCRYLVWMRMAWLSEGAEDAIEYAVKEFEAGPVVEEGGKKHRLDERAEKLQRGMETRLKRFRRTARWLWPQRTQHITSWASLPLESAISCIAESVKKASRKTPRLSEFREGMMRLAEDCADHAKHSRDVANSEVVWATATFALGALTISLYTLWLQIG